MLTKTTTTTKMISLTHTHSLTYSLTHIHSHNNKKRTCAGLCNVVADHGLGVGASGFKVVHGKGCCSLFLLFLLVWIGGGKHKNGKNWRMQFTKEDEGKGGAWLFLAP